MIQSPPKFPPTGIRLIPSTRVGRMELPVKKIIPAWLPFGRRGATYQSIEDNSEIELRGLSKSVFLTRCFSQRKYQCLLTYEGVHFLVMSSLRLQTRTSNLEDPFQSLPVGFIQLDMVFCLSPHIEQDGCRATTLGCFGVQWLLGWYSLSTLSLPYGL